MTHISFYILNGQVQRDLSELVCQLTEKAYNLHHLIYINSASIEQALYLDELLWTFKAESFIPHINLSVQEQQHESQQEQQQGSSLDFEHSVIIDVKNEVSSHFNPLKKQEVLINLSPEVPLFFSRFHRVLEVVNNSDEEKQLARQRYKFYKDRGYEITTHNL